MKEITQKGRLVQIVNPEAAVSLIPSEATVGFCGAGGGIMEPTAVIEALAEHFEKIGEPRNLTIITTTGLGDRAERGISPLAKEGLCRRAILGHWGQSPRMAELAEREKIEAYNYPQGVLSQMWRAIAAHQPGIITQTGLGTFLDPRQKGAKMNQITKEDLVSLIEIDGTQYLFYRAFHPDVCVIRGSTADVEGYITMEDEVTFMDVLPMLFLVFLIGKSFVAHPEAINKNFFWIEFKTLALYIGTTEKTG